MSETRFTRRSRRKDGSESVFRCCLGTCSCRSREKGFFSQSYEERETLDSAVRKCNNGGPRHNADMLVIMPLVFFMSAADPRFTSTLENILKTPEKGGLTANSSVYRYNTELSDDGVGGEEGAFSLCTLWTVEALTRAGVYNRPYLDKA
jgi:GH15 family glucan-1,4-alpha-glucosidase